MATEIEFLVLGDGKQETGALVVGSAIEGAVRDVTGIHINGLGYDERAGRNIVDGKERVRWFVDPWDIQFAVTEASPSVNLVRVHIAAVHTEWY